MRLQRRDPPFLVREHEILPPLHHQGDPHQGFLGSQAAAD